jgi:phosphoadenosine phosphosulfate reductase
MQLERARFDDLEIGEIALALDDREPQDVIAWGLETFGDSVAIVTSFQIDGLVVLDMAYRMKPDVRVVTVDSGRLPQATYEFMERVRERYPDMRLEVLFPDHREIETMVRRYGPNLFYRTVNQRLLCCHLRKVRPLLRALEGLEAWFTGLRRDQWASRAAIRKVEIDHDHDGIVKLNPLADWNKDDVWDYVRRHDVPYHPLYDRGYTSIGCEPCTRPIRPGEDDRAGRWWWETNAPKECGIHCPIETGGFEHELHALLGAAHGGAEWGDDGRTAEAVEERGTEAGAD